MTRRMLLVPVLAVALGGLAVFVKGQAGPTAGEKAQEQSDREKEQEDADIEATKDPVAKEEKKEVVEFYARYAKTFFCWTCPRNAIAPFFADDFTFTKVINGRGEVFNKAQWVDLRTHLNGDVALKGDHDIVKMHVFGSTVIMNGHSRTTIRYRGQISKGPRMFTFVFVKQHGKWQIVSMMMADIPNGPA